ncbi:hypothetical protein Lser_V15G01991 [Lactuca serriola]
MSGGIKNRKKKANAGSVTAVGKGSDNITGDQVLIASSAVEKIQMILVPIITLIFVVANSGSETETPPPPASEFVNKLEVDLRGQRVEEGIEYLKNYLVMLTISESSLQDGAHRSYNRRFVIYWINKISSGSLKIETKDAS